MDGLSQNSLSVVAKTVNHVMNGARAAIGRSHHVSALAAIILSPLIATAAVPDAHIQWSATIGQPIYNVPRVRDGVAFLDSTQADGPNVFAVKNGKIQWRFATGGAIPMPVTLGGSQVFVASDVGETHFMRALDAQTGKLIWNYAQAQPPECMCSHISQYLHHMLFAQTDGHSLFAFRPDGNIPTRRLWDFAGDGAKLTAPVVVDGVVIFGSSNHCVCALGASSGIVRWKHDTGYGFVARPIAAKDTVIIGDRGGNVHAYDAPTGKSLWTFAANGPIDTPAVIYHSLAFIAAGYGDWGIYAVSVQTGKQLWYDQMADYTDYAPIILDNTLIVASRDGTALGINPQSGKILWSTDLDGVPFSGPIPNGHHVVVKVGDHRLMNIETRTGTILWTYHSPAVITSPVIWHGTVYIGTSSGKLLALN